LQFATISSMAASFDRKLIPKPLPCPWVIGWRRPIHPFVGDAEKTGRQQLVVVCAGIKKKC
jgi:hypothetical protein